MLVIISVRLLESLSLLDHALKEKFVRVTLRFYDEIEMGTSEMLKFIIATTGYK